MDVRLTIAAACVCLTACTGPLVRPAVAPAAPRRDALLILPGVGYGRAGEETFRSLAESMGRDGVDLYVPAYVTRSGLAASRDRLERFIRAHRLDRYDRLHVFAFIAGAWVVNPLVERGALPNLTAVIYDRSPLQERAPRIADTQLHFLTWLRYGSTVFDLARTPYPPLAAPGVKVALMVETAPTSFIRRNAAAARRDGPLTFSCGSLHQRYDDCLYLPFNHGEVYARFAEVWPEVRAFIRDGRFSDAANRQPPDGDPLAPRRGR
jgi:hypothetical protein